MIKPYEDFKETEIIKYGAFASSVSTNKAPLFIKNELNNLYNYLRLKFSEDPLLWDERMEYSINNFVFYNNKVYIATKDNKNKIPISNSEFWNIFDIDSNSINSKYVNVESEFYVKLINKNNIMMFSSGDNEISALMTTKNGLVPWDNGISSVLGNTNRKFKEIYSVDSYFSNINASSGIIDTLNASTITVDNVIGTARDAIKLTNFVNINLTGEITGSVKFDGSTDVNINATINNDIHNHDLRYYTQSETNNKYLYKNDSAIDSNLLNGKSSAIEAAQYTIVLRDNLSNINANEFKGTATSARYADVAEKFTSDIKYKAGTVLGFGGDKELTLFNENTPIAGVVSTKPGFLLNSEIEGVYIALKGRVPCKIKGEALKGQYIIAKKDGLGVALNDYTFEESKKLLGIAISNSKNGIVEIKV